MNVVKWFSSLLNDGKRHALPIVTHPGIEMIGRTVREAVSDGYVHFEAIKALSEQYPGSIANTTIMDLTVEAEAFGANIFMPEDEVPSITGRLLTSLKDIEELKIPNMNVGRLQEYLKATRLAAENLNKPVFSGCIGPFSLAGRLYDMTEIMMSIYIEPDTIKLLLEKCTQFIIDYCESFKKSGAAGVIMAEPAAGLLSNADCEAFSSVYVKRIVEEVQDENFVVILHNCGNTGNCTSAMLSTNSFAYHFGNNIDILDVLNNCDDETIIMGNIDPVGCFKMGTEQEVYDVTMSLLQDTKMYHNFIISSGCDIPPSVPCENIRAFYSAINTFNLNN